MTARASVAGLAFGATVMAMSAVPAEAQTVVQSIVIASEPQPFTADDLLWMEVRVGDIQIAESMNVYASRAGVFVPLAEFSRILDFAVGVFPGQQRAEGWVLSPDRKLIVDLKSRTALINGRTVTFVPNQAALYADDLYVRVDLLEQLLPVKLKPDVSAQVLTVTPSEPLPFQERLAREGRAAALGQGPPPDDVVRLATPYKAFSPPAFDVNLGGQITRDGQDQSRNYDIRAAGDLAFGSFQGFVGSDDEGKIGSVRLLLERKDPDGRALGVLGATRAGIGDVFTPAMPMGAGSSGGRGAYYTSAPLENLDLATPLDLRGELPIGEEVELYVNEVLRAAQSTPIKGRYEFLDVPLTFGLNTIRLVFYGAQGQRHEEVRRVNFGTGQVEAGRLVLRLGAVQQGRAVIDVTDPSPEGESGAARVVAMLDYGVNANLTLSGGAARFTPRGREARSLGLAGVRGSLGGVAAQLNLAYDDLGGSGASLGVAARPFGVSLVGSHAEFAGGFIDETRQMGSGDDDTLLVRASELRAESQVDLRGLKIPVSFEIQRNERRDGSWMMSSALRSSAPIDRFYVSGALAYEREKTATADQERLLGSADVSTLVAANIQFRGGVSYTLSPGASLDTAYATADMQLTESNALRLALTRSFGSQASTNLQVSNLYRAKYFDLAANAAYEIESQEWRVGMQISFGLAYDHQAGGYRFARPGVSSGGSATLNAFIDDNGDGVRQPAETPIPAMVLETPAGAYVTDKHGRAQASGLGDAGKVRLRVNAEGIDDPFLVGGPAVVEFVPRPGRVVDVNYPMQQSAEVELVAKVRREGASRPLSALNIIMTPTAGGAAIKGRSDHAGVIFLEGVRPGTYDLTLDPSQAGPLGLKLAQPVKVVVPPKGGYVRAGDVLIDVVQGTMQ